MRYVFNLVQGCLAGIGTFIWFRSIAVVNLNDMNKICMYLTTAKQEPYA